MIGIIVTIVGTWQVYIGGRGGGGGGGGEENQQAIYHVDWHALAVQNILWFLEHDFIYFQVISTMDWKA